MASPPQMQVSAIDRLSDDILQDILDLAMGRDSPFFIDDLERGLDTKFRGNTRDAPQHHRTLQPAHRKDWIAINSTSRRIRAFGKISFFSAKTIAMHAELPARLQRNAPNAIKGMMPDDQALALSYIRDMIIVNPKESAPITFATIPRTVALFPCLRRCTLLFGFTPHDGYKYEGSKKCFAHDVEWITAAFVLGVPVPLKMQEHMAGIGMPRGFRLEEAMGPGSNWPSHLCLMEDIYPTLRVKAELIRVKEEKERLAASQVVSQI